MKKKGNCNTSKDRDQKHIHIFALHLLVREMLTPTPLFRPFQNSRTQTTKSERPDSSASSANSSPTSKDLGFVSVKTPRTTLKM